MNPLLPPDLQAFLGTLLDAVWDPLVWWEAGVLVLAAAGAWLVHRTMGQGIETRSAQADEYAVRHLALKTLQRILFPLSMLPGVFAGRALLHAQGYPVKLLDLAVPLLASLATIRIVVYFLRKTFRPGPAVKAWENLIATSIWIVVALHVLGWLPAVLESLDAMALKVWTSRISVLATLKLLLAVALLWLLALWLGRVVEHRISRAVFVNPAMQVALVKLVKFVLLVLAFLVALDAVGIDLTALTVFGGALGVGLGFGLQRIASNYVSGFIILLDRSIRIGDLITVDNRFGQVTQINTRYTLLKAQDGSESIVPNETLITQTVVNQSLSKPEVRIALPIQVAYSSDLGQARDILLEVARKHPRIIQDGTEAPRVMLRDFAENGINMELAVWIRDPEAGQANLRSDLNWAIWQAFTEGGVEIPFPQRVVHLAGGAPPTGKTS